MILRQITTFVVALTLIITMSCGSSGDDILEPPVAGGGGPKPNPNGVLLPGDPTDVARDATSDLPPSAVPDSDISNGLLTTRLDGMMASGATVSQVNDALTSVGARIVTMTAGSPVVTLKVDAVADEAAARVLSDALRATDAFTHVAPAHALEIHQLPPRTSFTATSSMNRASVSGDAIAHLEASRFLTAWSLRHHADTNNSEITVLVPDEYTSSIPHNEIDAQSFSGFGGALFLPGPDIFPGNNGFVVSGIIGANVDETNPTGTSPIPVDLLDIDSMPLGGMTWNDIMWLLSWKLASSGDRFVLNTGIGYNDPDITTYSVVDRAMHVVAWRVAASTHYSRFVHATAAGIEGDHETLNSPFIAAMFYDDIREMGEGLELSSADSLVLEETWEDVQANFPPAANAATNVIVVGAAEYGGAQLAGTAPGAVYAIGSGVVGPCTDQDPSSAAQYLCDGEVAYYSGTGVATAQVSGLAAYLMSLGDNTAGEIRSAIQSSYDHGQNGVIDAYDAAMRLDGISVGSVRHALVDVAGFESSNSDGNFNEWDLHVLVGLSPAAGGFNPPVSPEDVVSLERRFDLNGDGEVGGFGTGRFDLDADGSYGDVTLPYDAGTLEMDENAVTDFDIACYLAYSDLYTGDQLARAQLLVPAKTGLFVEFVNFPDRIAADELFAMTVRAGYLTDTGPEYTEGIEIDFNVDNGRDYAGGTTGPDGSYSTMIRLYANDNELFVEAIAEADGNEATANESALRHDEIEIVSRSVFVGASVFSVYNEDVGIPARDIIRLDDYEQLDHLDPIQKTYMREGSNTAVGMSVSGSATTEITTNLDLGSGTDFYGASLDASSDASITLTNPNTSILSYQAQSNGWIDVSIEFNVWGTSAAFNMHGSVSGQYYDIELSGNDQTFECDSHDAPCATISTGGTLKPGTYDLDWSMENEGFIHSNEQSPSQGTISESGTIDINFEVNHNAAMLSTQPHRVTVEPRKLSAADRERIARRHARRKQMAGMR